MTTKLAERLGEDQELLVPLETRAELLGWALLLEAERPAGMYLTHGDDGSWLTITNSRSVVALLSALHDGRCRPAILDYQREDMESLLDRLLTTGHARGTLTNPYFLIERNDRGQSEWYRQTSQGFSWETGTERATRYPTHKTASDALRWLNDAYVVSAPHLMITAHEDV
jgi:hypothetical protein